MSLWGVIYKSTKTELKIVATTLGVLFILPLFAVVVIANAGIAEVVHALVSLNPITHLVEIHDANGKLVNTVQVSTVWPVNGVVTLEFGQNDLPYQLYHTGIDIANRHKQIGDPVTPFMAGTVIDARTVTGYGNYVMVDNGNNVVSIYGHLSQILTSKGQDRQARRHNRTRRNDGLCYWPHVHFEIRVYGIPVNPRLFMVGNPNPGP